MKTDTPRAIRLKDYQPPTHLIDKVDMNFVLDANKTKVRARLKIRPNPAAKTKTGPLVLDGEGLNLESLAIDGRPLSAKDYKITDTSLRLQKPPLKAFLLEINTCLDPDANKALQGLYRSRGVYCTQCEAQGFRRITYFLDRPDVLSTYTVRIEAGVDDAPVLLSNGNRIERGTLARGKRHYAVWRDPHPKPCYLFALVGGDLSSIASNFKTAGGRDVELAIYVEHGKEDRAAWAMDSLKRSMRWDEVRFGREYDLDVFNIVAVSDFNMGAMENKGLNIFNDRLILASKDTASDAMFQSIEAVVAHEYFHNWTGNRITCRDWFQLCLKEGLTVYRDQEFSADERSAVVQRIGDVRKLKAQQFPEDAGPLAHPVRPDSYIEINNFYTATVYEKGAELVRMIETIVGRDDFRAGMDLYFDRHDGEAVTIEDFLVCFEEGCEADLGQFKLWYTQAGTPELRCALKYNAEKKTARLNVEQILPPTPGQTKKKPLHIPIRIGLIGEDGQDIALITDDDAAIDTGILHVTQTRQSFDFKKVFSRPVPSLLRGFSAPANLTFDLSEQDLEFLIRHDSDPFNLWQAANTYATRTLVEITKARQAEKRSSKGKSYARALGAALKNKNLEPAFLAEVLKLPTQSDIARVIGVNVDPDHIFRAHRQLSRLIARELGDDLTKLYTKMQPRGAFSPDATSAGQRALRNAALTLLAQRGTPADIKRISEHFNNAKNMTDEAHGLILLANLNVPDRKKALARFYERWNDDHVVIDTWFGAQAQSSRGATLNEVRALTKHPRFDIKAPNKVRALIGSFVLSNPVQFNRPDGRGYQFLADQILTIDRFNPQIAARLSGALRNWQSLEGGRRKLARKALTRIAAAKNLSNDVYEIVTKTLAG